MSDEGAPGGSEQERRKHRRKRCFLPAKLVTAEGSFDCRVLDLSQSGAKVETGAGLEVANGQEFTLAVETLGTFPGLVIWRNDGCLGLGFVTKDRTAKVSPAALAAFAEQLRGPGSAGPEGVAPAGDLAPLAPQPEQRMALRRGDVICVLRKDDAKPDYRLEVASCTATFAAGAFADHRLVEMDARQFMEFLSKAGKFAMTVMRVDVPESGQPNRV